MEELQQPFIGDPYTVTDDMFCTCGFCFMQSAGKSTWVREWEHRRRGRPADKITEMFEDR